MEEGEGSVFDRERYGNDALPLDALAQEGNPAGFRNREVLLAALNQALELKHYLHGGPRLWVEERDDRMLLRSERGLAVFVPAEAQTLKGTLDLADAWERLQLAGSPGRTSKKPPALRTWKVTLSADVLSQVQAGKHHSTFLHGLALDATTDADGALQITVQELEATPLDGAP